MPGMHKVATPSTTFSRGSLLLLFQLFPNHPIYFLWNQGVYYAFLDQAVADFEQGLDSILTDSLETPNWTLPWMSLMPLHLVQSLLDFSPWLVPFLIILSCSLFLAFKLVNCGTRLGLFLPLCLWLPRCWHLNWSITFLATLLPLDSGPLLNQTTSLWILPTGKLISLPRIFRLVLVPLHMLLLTQSNSFLPSRLPLLILFPCCPRLREMLYMCLKCVNYFSGFMTFWTRLGNSACILAHLFNSVSRQHCKIWTSQFPFLHSLKEVIPPSEACLYGCINWSLAQAHSVGLSQVFSS